MMPTERPLGIIFLHCGGKNDKKIGKIEKNIRQFVMNKSGYIGKMPKKVAYICALEQIHKNE